MRRSSAGESARTGFPSAGGAAPFARHIGLVLGALLATAAAAATAAEEDVRISPWVALPNARVRLLAGPPEAATGYLGGVELQLADGWKTYWRMPGDAGVPPSFDWSGSRNVAPPTVLYPAPKRFAEPAATTVGYSGSVIFPVAIVPFKASSAVELSLDMTFGICRDICIPAEAHLALTVTPTDQRGPPSARLLAWLARVPRTETARRDGDPEVVSATASLAGPTPRLLIAARFAGGDAGADLFLEARETDDVYVPLPQRLADGGDGTVRFAVDLARTRTVETLRGKTLRLTLVGEHGASDRLWTIP
jgi:DsbC/DsbD-like thiol-disulfide interchange protein